MNRANKAQYLLQTGDSSESVARLFNVSEQTLAEWVKLCEMPQAAQDAVESGKVSASAVVKLHGLSKDDQRIAIDELVSSDGGKPTVKKANAIAKFAKNKKEGGSKEPAVVAPSKRDLRRMIAEGREAGISEDVIMGIRYAIGDLAAAKVKGVSRFLSKDSAAAE